VVEVYRQGTVRTYPLPLSGSSPFNLSSLDDFRRGAEYYDTW
jgi:hypothetical protein